jgi:hypothetical protein
MIAGSMTREYLQSFQGKDIAAAQEETRDLLAQLPVERGVGLRELHGHIAAGKTNEGGQFPPAFLPEINIYLGWIGQQGAGGQFFFTGIHVQVSITSR